MLTFCFVCSSNIFQKRDLKKNTIYKQKLLDVPSAPENVEAISQSGSAMLVKWESLGRSSLPVTKQVIYARIVNKDENPGHWFKATTSPPEITDESGALVGNLHPFTYYEFRVKASNTMGDGRFSEASEPERTQEGSKFLKLEDIIYYKIMYT